MSDLTTSERKHLPTNAFAEPQARKYPIEDRAHAVNAKARVAQHGTPAEKRQVDDAVQRKYPGMGGSKSDPKGSFSRPNAANNAGGVPRKTGDGQRQLDGSRTPEFSQPQKRPGMAERQPAPHSSSGGSGMEHAMGALADQLHPRKQGPRGRQ